MTKADSTWHYDMAVNLRSTQTGLPKLVWVSTRTEEQGPRIKIGIDPIKAKGFDECATMTISEKPEVVGDIPKEITETDINVIRKWVLLNKDVLLEYWQDDISSTELFLKLRQLTDTDSHPK
jgi:hypothetical protein